MMNTPTVDGLPWTPERKRDLAQMVADGMDADAIARKTGRTPESIKRQVQRQELEFKAKAGSRWRDPHNEQLRRLCAEGKTAAEISEIMDGNRTPLAIHNQARALKISPLPQLEKGQTRDRSMAEEARLGMVGLRALSLPLHKLAEAFK
jgi:DNA-binding CsgD family transcriptional regulator